MLDQGLVDFLRATSILSEMQKVMLQRFGRQPWDLWHKDHMEQMRNDPGPTPPAP
jgi:hypothetical protein